MKKRTMLMAATLLLACSAMPQEPQKENISKKKNIIRKTVDILFYDIDTTYIEPDKYNMDFSVYNNNWFDSYYIKSHDEQDQSISLSQRPSYNVGAYIGWSILSIGWSINIKDTFGKVKSKSKKNEFDLSLIGTFIGCDMYYRQFTDGFKINNTEGIIDKSKFEDYKGEIDGVESKLLGINGWYIFNRKKVAYPSVYSHSSRQKKSCGSAMLGLSYTLHEFKFDPQQLPKMYLENLSKGFNFKQFSYHDISIGAGYTYNWAFKKNFNANVTMMPSVAYIISRIKKENEPDPYYKNIQFEILGKAGIIYNTSKYYAGCMFQMRAYTKFRDKTSFVNSLGNLSFFVGFNFWKIKQK